MESATPFPKQSHVPAAPFSPLQLCAAQESSAQSWSTHSLKSCTFSALNSISVSAANFCTAWNCSVPPGQCLCALLHLSGHSPEQLQHPAPALVSLCSPSMGSTALAPSLVWQLLCADVKQPQFQPAVTSDSHCCVRCLLLMEQDFKQSPNTAQEQHNLQIPQVHPVPSSAVPPLPFRDLSFTEPCPNTLTLISLPHTEFSRGF